MAADKKIRNANFQMYVSKLRNMTYMTQVQFSPHLKKAFPASGPSVLVMTHVHPSPHLQITSLVPEFPPTVSTLRKEELSVPLAVSFYDWKLTISTTYPSCNMAEVLCFIYNYNQPCIEYRPWSPPKSSKEPRIFFKEVIYLTYDL